jgi:hypothetical protein
MLNRIAMPVRRASGPDGVSRYCDYLWDSLTVLSDGSITCGFDDPYRRRNFGNIAAHSIAETFNGSAVRQLRERLLGGTACRGCHLHARLRDRGDTPLPSIPAMPRRLILEPTIRCNLRCRNPVCDLNNDRSFEQRDEPFLRWESFAKLMDEAGPHLEAM